MPAHFSVKAKHSTGFAVFLMWLLGACALPPPANVPAAIYEKCQREVSLLTRAEPASDKQMMDTPAEQTAGRTIDDARLAKAEARIGGLADWPEEALLVRCFAGNDIQLTPDQAALLSKWTEHDRQAQGSR